VAQAARWPVANSTAAWGVRRRALRSAASVAAAAEAGGGSGGVARSGTEGERGRGKGRFGSRDGEREHDSRRRPGEAGSVEAGLG
jgi:hypothetical protein